MSKTTLTVFLATLVGVVPLRSQEPVDLDMIRRIRAEATEGSRVLEMFSHLTDVIGPRLTATPAYLEAAEWAAESLQAWGLADVHLESWEFGRGWTLEGLTLEMTAPRYFPLIGFPEAWTPSTAGTLEGTPVYIGDMTADEVLALGDRIRGAIVLATRPQPGFITQDRPQPTEHEDPVRIGAPPFVRAEGPVGRRELPALMREVGAGVVLQPTQGQHGTVFVTGRRDTPDDSAPSIHLAGEHYNLLVRMIQQGRAPTLRVALDVRYHQQDLNGYNVIAEIPGTDPDIGDEVVMVGAHLDSWHAATGGIDNADASASLLEAVRILTALGVRPRRTIRMALWGGEEQGLHGSHEWVQRHLGEEHAEARENLSVYFNHDPGTGPIYGFYAEGNAEAKAIFDAWLEPLVEVGARRNLIDEIGSTDHVSFVQVGLPGFNTVQSYVDYDVRSHHTNADFFERISEADLQQAAIVLATFVYHAAMRDGRIPRGSGAS